MAQSSACLRATSSLEFCRCRPDRSYLTASCLINEIRRSGSQHRSQVGILLTRPPDTNSWSRFGGSSSGQPNAFNASDANSRIVCHSPEPMTPSGLKQILSHLVEGLVYQVEVVQLLARQFRPEIPDKCRPEIVEIQSHLIRRMYEGGNFPSFRRAG